MIKNLNLSNHLSISNSANQKRQLQKRNLLFFVFSLLTIVLHQQARAGTYFHSVSGYPVAHLPTLTPPAFAVNQNPGIAGFKEVPTPEVTVVNNCGSSTLSTTATGSLLWSTGETTSSITVSKTGIYAVKQTVEGATSGAGVGIAAPMPIPSKPVITVTNSCGFATLSTTATGALSWSTGQTISVITVSVPGPYTLTQSTNGCASKATSVTATPKAIPLIPAIAVENNCGFSTLSTTATGKLLWNTGETKPSVKVSLAGTYTVTATINGCASAPGSGIAEPKGKPPVPEVSVVDNCGSSTLSTSATGALLWSNGLITQAIEVPAAGTYTVKQTVDGCTSAAGSGTAAPLKKPIITAPDINISTNADNCSAQVDFATNVNLKGTPATFVEYGIGIGVITSPHIFPLGKTTVRVLAENSCGSDEVNFVVRVRDNVPPSIICTLDATVDAPALSNTYTVSGKEFDATASDNCGTPILIYRLEGATVTGYSSENISLNGQEFKVGATAIIWKAKDASGNISICQTKFIVKGFTDCKGCPKNPDPPSPPLLEVNPRNNEVADIKQIKPGVNVMPNPSAQYFTLTLNSKSFEKFQITVIDITGRIIEQKSNIPAKSTLQIGSDYLPGIYIAKIMQGKKEVLVKLIKINK